MTFIKRETITVKMSLGISSSKEDKSTLKYYSLTLFRHLLADIKRKTSEGGYSTQLVPYDKVFDIDKVKKECTSFSKDMSLLKSRQNELEKLTQMMYNQNNQLVKENKLLWNELIKSK